ncbi:MAG: response regulator transcription factor [Armatimonadetes bacterium]|nr:response regulator transcription factor [Armatimonadota bacterium]
MFATQGAEAKEAGKKVLVVEDEPRVAEFISSALNEFGYIVTWSESGADGLQRLQSGDFDLAILDVLLPDCDGFEVLAAARRKGMKTPVMMLTAKTAVEDRVKGLDLGADDYIPKPFELSELMARVRALLRRRSAEYDWLTLADLTLEPVTRQVTRGEKRIDLTAREFSLLEYMLRNKGKPLSRAQIMENVWNDPNGDSTVVPVYINYLRTKIELPGCVRLIHTVRGVGYVLEVRDFTS